MHFKLSYKHSGQPWWKYIAANCSTAVTIEKGFFSSLIIMSIAGFNIQLLRAYHPVLHKESVIESHRMDPDPNTGLRSKTDQTGQQAAIG